MAFSSAFGAPAAQASIHACADSTTGCGVTGFPGTPFTTKCTAFSTPRLRDVFPPKTFPVTFFVTTRAGSESFFSVAAAASSSSALAVSVSAFATFATAQPVA